MAISSASERQSRASQAISKNWIRIFWKRRALESEYKFQKRFSAVFGCPFLRFGFIGDPQRRLFRPKKRINEN